VGLHRLGPGVVTYPGGICLAFGRWPASTEARVLFSKKNRGTSEPVWQMILLCGGLLWKIGMVCRSTSSADAYYATAKTVPGAAWVGQGKPPRHTGHKSNQAWGYFRPPTQPTNRKRFLSSYVLLDPFQLFTVCPSPLLIPRARRGRPTKYFFTRSWIASTAEGHTIFQSSQAPTVPSMAKQGGPPSSFSLRRLVLATR